MESSGWISSPAAIQVASLEATSLAYLFCVHVSEQTSTLSTEKKNIETKKNHDLSVSIFWKKKQAGWWFEPL